MNEKDKADARSAVFRTFQPPRGAISFDAAASERLVQRITDLLATARKEAREAVFREAAEKVHAMSRIDARDKSSDFLAGAAWLQNKAALMLATLSVEAATDTDSTERG